MWTLSQEKRLVKHGNPSISVDDSTGNCKLSKTIITKESIHTSLGMFENYHPSAQKICIKEVPHLLRLSFTSISFISRPFFTNSNYQHNGHNSNHPCTRSPHRLPDHGACRMRRFLERRIQPGCIRRASRLRRSNFRPSRIVCESAEEFEREAEVC